MKKVSGVLFDREDILLLNHLVSYNQNRMYSTFLPYRFQSLSFVRILLQGFDISDLIWVHIISSSIHTITMTRRLLKDFVFVYILVACWWSKKMYGIWFRTLTGNRELVQRYAFSSYTIFHQHFQINSKDPRVILCGDCFTF